MVAFSEGSSAPHNCCVVLVLHMVDKTTRPLSLHKSNIDSICLLENGDCSVYTYFTGFSLLLTLHLVMSCKCQLACNESNKDKAFKIQVLQFWKGWAEDVEQACPFQETLILGDSVY